MGETAEGDLNATTYVHQPTLPLRQGDDEMSSRIGPQAWSRWCGRVSGTRAGMRPKCLLYLSGVSASLRCLISSSRWLVGCRLWSTSSQTGHPCRSLMICRTQQCLYARSRRPSHTEFNFLVTRPSFCTRHLFASCHIFVLSRQTLLQYYCPSFSDQASPDQPNSNHPPARAITQGSLPAARYQ